MMMIQHGSVGYQKHGVFPPSTERKRFSTLKILFKVEQKIISFFIAEDECSGQPKREEETSR